MRTHGLLRNQARTAKKAHKEKISAVHKISVVEKSYFTTLTDDHCYLSLSASTEAPAKFLLV